MNGGGGNDEANRLLEEQILQQKEEIEQKRQAIQQQRMAIIIGIDLLPTIRDLNRIIEYSRKNLAFKANPPLFYDADKYFNPHLFRKWSGAMIARNPNGRNPLEALQMPEYPEVLEHIRTKFNKENTERLIDCLTNYSKVFDEKNNIYKDHPLHDWTSHAVDAYQTMTLAVEHQLINEQTEIISYY